MLLLPQKSLHGHCVHLTTCQAQVYMLRGKVLLKAKCAIFDVQIHITVYISLSYTHYHIIVLFAFNYFTMW